VGVEGIFLVVPGEEVASEALGGLDTAKSVRKPGRIVTEGDVPNR
jgi:hypothetical protein